MRVGAVEDVEGGLEFVEGLAEEEGGVSYVV